MRNTRKRWFFEKNRSFSKYAAFSISLFFQLLKTSSSLIFTNRLDDQQTEEDKRSEERTYSVRKIAPPPNIWKRLKYVSFDVVFYADSDYHDFITQNLFFDEENSELPADISLFSPKFDKHNFSSRSKEKKKSDAYLCHCLYDESKEIKYFLHYSCIKARYVYKIDLRVVDLMRFKAPPLIEFWDWGQFFKLFVFSF